jgi:dipeptidyl aminopeptidase/acylaminoacyl peptidase
MRILKVHLTVARLITLFAAGSVVHLCGQAPQEQPHYQKAPAEIAAILDAPATPTVSISPAHDRMLLVQGVRYPSIAELAQPMLRLAGVRINPMNNGPHRAVKHVGYTLCTIPDGREQKLAVPPNAHLGLPSWSPDGKRFAFLNYSPNAVELWVGDAVTGRLKRLHGAMNAAYGEVYQWMPDNQTIICKIIPARRGPAPVQQLAPSGPVVQESAGKASSIRTYEDLLKDGHDENLFEYYATSQLALINVSSGKLTLAGKPAIFSSFEPSPDGQHLLTVRIHRPFSYLLPASGFPREVEVLDREGRLEHKLASLGLSNPEPAGGATRGPRSQHWRPTEPSTLVWVAASERRADSGQRAGGDRLFMLRAPFQDKPLQFAKTDSRYSGLTWGEGGFAILRESDQTRRRNRTWFINPDDPSSAPRKVWDRASQDRYGDPGTVLTRSLPNGQRVVRRSGNFIYLNGAGATPDGERPFLDRLDILTLKSERLFRCDEKSYESLVSVLDDDAAQIITRWETPADPPNYHLRSLRDGTVKLLTHFADPAPQLRGIQKRLVTYKREDGVPLSFTLHLPAGYKEGRLPTVVWAYPREYGDADSAGQISGSPNRFTTISGISHLFLLTQGYAILDGATMPVVGDSRTMNNTYIEQIVASAKAAIDKAVEIGVTDRDRVGVGGHSYGAFMTANLLAHSDVFRAGIARSGAYNRSLTPFGFQSERRTLWQAQDMYIKVSPFMAANKINEPLLLIHGEADNNSGTFPIQSERMFQAVQGNGGRARLVMLPHESHGYEARESVEHVLHEMIAWFEKYVKPPPPKPSTPAAE